MEERGRKKKALAWGTSASVASAGIKCVAGGAAFLCLGRGNKEWDGPRLKKIFTSTEIDKPCVKKRS